ncbi:MAG: LamG-like jellyroll fold domain-containing protein, partial [Bacteroidota bacterium]
MKRTHILLFMMLSLCLPGMVWAQNSPNCSTYTDDDYLTGQAFFSYGAISGAYNSNQLRVNMTAGQAVVGTSINLDYTVGTGFWASLQLPPAAPVVRASEGDLDDRVQIDWTPDPLSPAANSFKIYRNGALLATVDGETYSFIDFNVLAGKFYTYEVAGVNVFGEGFRGSALGFLNPNGVVTGQVKSSTGNPVPGAVVTLTPTIGASARFGGDDMIFSEYNPSYPRSQFTLSCWVKIDDGNDNTAIFDLGSHIGKNWWLHTLPAADGKGVRFGMGNGSGGVTELEYAFPAATADAWHNVAVSYNGSSVLLYVDGELIETAVTGVATGSSPLFLGQKPDASGYFTGNVDELRFYNRQLAQTEIQMFL